MIRCHLCDGEKGYKKLSCLHDTAQDTRCDAWLLMLELVEKAAQDRVTTFAPFQDIPLDQWPDVVTLPASIATLKCVETLVLYNSRLTHIPPEIGGMTRLREFTPYTSRHLHWFPYEITRCKQLARSTVSTRCLYGNHKFRTPFPALEMADNLACMDLYTPDVCSVCCGPFEVGKILRRWISLNVATDVLPLLVHACSVCCIEALPTPHDNFVDHPHVGGVDVEQPLTQSEIRRAARAEAKKK